MELLNDVFPLLARKELVDAAREGNVRIVTLGEGWGTGEVEHSGMLLYIRGEAVHVLAVAVVTQELTQPGRGSQACIAQPPRLNRSKPQRQCCRLDSGLP
jgi:hypothetical protein